MSRAIYSRLPVYVPALTGDRKPERVGTAMACLVDANGRQMARVSCGFFRTVMGPRSGYPVPIIRQAEWLPPGQVALLAPHFGMAEALTGWQPDDGAELLGMPVPKLPPELPSSAAIGVAWATPAGAELETA